MMDGDLQVKFASKKLWDESALRAARPIIDVCRLVAGMVSERVVTKGRSATGQPFGSYAATWEGFDFGVPSHMEQPRSGRTRYNPKTGIAYYESRAAYERARGRTSKYKNFVMSGGMWGGLTVKVSTPAKAKISFSGKTPPSLGGEGSNAKKASFSASKEGKNILEISDVEFRHVVTYVSRYIDATIIAAATKAERRMNVKKLEARVKKRLATARRAVEALTNHPSKIR